MDWLLITEEGEARQTVRWFRSLNVLDDNYAFIKEFWTSNPHILPSRPMIHYAIIVMKELRGYAKNCIFVVLVIPCRLYYIFSSSKFGSMVVVNEVCICLI